MMDVILGVLPPPANRFCEQPRLPSLPLPGR